MTRHVLPFLCFVALSCARPDAPAEEAPEAASPAAVVPPSDPATPLEPSGPVVVFLGTSLTAGYGLPSAEDTYIARLTELADSAGIPMRAINAGVSGDTSAGGLRRLDALLAQPIDILVVELGANDGLRGQNPDGTADNLRAVVERTHARWPDAAVVIAGMRAPPNLGPDFTSRFADVFPTVARETDSALIPFILEGVAGIRDLNQGDGIHPTPEGHRIMADNVWAILEPLLQEAAARVPATPGAG